MVSNSNSNNEESWDVVRLCKDQESCRMCEKEAVSVWAAQADDEWPLCESCQQLEFGAAATDSPSATKEALTTTIHPMTMTSSTTPATTSLIHSSTTENIVTSNHGDPALSTPATKAKPNNTNNTSFCENSVDSSNKVHQVSPENPPLSPPEEVWTMTQVLSVKDISNCPIKCKTEECTMAAAVVYRSNIDPAKWYSCLDCQENDFGGWPELDEIPLQFMTYEHRKALLQHCSRKANIDMPRLPQPADETGDVTTNTNSPVAESQPPQVSAKHKQLHDQWQEQAYKMGGSRIVVAKPVAKKLIYDFLSDSFAPMNINQIHKGLKAEVPSPVLKACLQEMLDNKSTEGFVYDSDEEDEIKPTKQASAANATAAPRESLLFKAAKHTSASLYYVNYQAMSNNGNGLNLDDRNELFASVAVTQTEQQTLQLNLQTLQNDITRLLSEPVNMDLEALLVKGESSLESIHEQVEEARKVLVDVKHVQSLKRRIQHMTTEWRKRRRLCMNTLVNLEEASDGSISAAKCLKGDGPIEMDSDETVAKAAVDFAKKKRNAKVKTIKNAAVTLSDPNFVAVHLDSQGLVERVYVDPVA